MESPVNHKMSGKKHKKIDQQGAAVANTPTLPVEYTDLRLKDEMPVKRSSGSLHKLDHISKRKLTHNVQNDQQARGKAVQAVQEYSQYDIVLRKNFAGNLSFDDTTNKLHNYASIEILKHPDDDTVHFSLRQMMDLTGERNRYTMSRKLAASTDLLAGLSVGTNNLNKPSGYYEPFADRVVMYDHGHYKNGRGWLRLDKDYIKELRRHAVLMVYPKVLFKLKGVARDLYDEFCYNKQTNLRGPKKKQDRLKMRTVLKYTGLPKWASVTKTRTWKKRIFDKLDKAIKQIEAKTKAKFIFFNSHGEKVKEIYNLQPDEFLESYIAVKEWDPDFIKAINYLHNPSKRHRPARNATEVKPKEKSSEKNRASNPLPQ